MTKFSLITPTQEREGDLLMRYQQLLSQSERSWEWLILDTSSQPSRHFACLKDPRVFYHHVNLPMTIGAKRNWLRTRARGTWIVHCDDDDFFSREYLTAVEPLLEGTHLLKAQAWYAFDRDHRQLYYVDGLEPMHSIYHFDPLSSARVHEVSGETFYTQDAQQKILEGYGFSAIYHREATQEIAFPSKDLGEDIVFCGEIKKRGLSCKNYRDSQGIIVKSLHCNNVSKHYSQYRLPPFALPILLPDFAAYLQGDLTL